jgi:outer membrane protein TolC
MMLLVLSSGSLIAAAQQKPLYNTNTSNHSPLPDSTIENRLVVLALQAPRFNALGHQINVSRNNLILARRTWFNLLTLSADYNDQTFAKQTNPAYVYPKYFFGLTIPIGLFFTMGPQIHAAQETVLIAQDNQEELARTIRMDVLSKYITYKNYEALILMQNTIVVDQQAALSQIEQKFRDGTASIDQFNLANRGFSEEKTKLLNLQLSQDLVRLDIERLIGISLSAVTR